MLKYTKILFAIVLCIAFTACDNWVDPNIPKPSPFKVTFEGGTSIGAAGGTLSVRVDAGTNGWWVTIPPGNSWCTVNQTYGSGDKVVTVRVAANSTNADRQVEITFNPTFDLPPETFTVTQSR